MNSALVLVGAGHVHMALLGQVKRLRAAGYELILVDSGSFWYGAQPARLMTGELGRDTLRIALGTFCQKRGVRHCADRAIGLDTRHRRVWLASGARLDYDRVALNVGGETDDARFDAAAGVRIWRASAMQELVRLRAALGEDCARGGRPRIAIVGAGQHAAEIAAGLSAADLASQCRITWFLPGERALTNAPAGAARRLMRILSLRHVDVVMATIIDGVVDGCVYSRDQRRFAVDHLVLADAVRGARFIHAGKLPADTAGLHVTGRLQSPKDPRVFASGGCARLRGARAINPVDVERQARVMASNLIAAANNRPLKTYWPTSGVQSIDLADGRAIAWRGRLWWHNALTARLRARRDAKLRERLQFTPR